MKTAHPLAWVLLHKVMIAYLIFAVGMTSVQLYFEYRRIRQDVIQTLDLMTRTFASGAVKALWDYQEELLQSLANGIGEHQLVAAVEISDLHNRLNAAWRSADAEAVSPELTVRQTLYYRFEDGQQEALGTLSISSSEARVLALLKNTALSLGLSIITQLLFLGGALAVLSRMLVVKPLTRFSEQVSQLVTEDDRARPIDLGPIEIAEIAILQQGFNRLLQQVAESHALIVAANADLEQRVAERTRDLDERNEQLTRENALILALVRASPGFVCILDGRGQILVANAAAETLIGNPKTLLLEQSWPMLPVLAAADHPLRQLFDEVHVSGEASIKASFPNNAGQERMYQFEALRIGHDADARIIVVGMDITEEHRQKLHLHHQAFHDRLTELPNRALLLERLQQTLIAATRRKASFAVAFIDLDQFKPINDSAGHEAGDVVLREIAHRLRQCVRESDTVARQ